MAYAQASGIHIRQITYASYAYVTSIACIDFVLDINECMMPVECPSPDGMICKNVEGWYDCDCPPGTSQEDSTICVCKSLTVVDSETT